MNKSALLVEVYKLRIDDNHTVHKDLFRRRIATNYADIENWLNANAKKWVEKIGWVPQDIEVNCDDYCCGEILRDGYIPFTFETHNIATI